MPSSIRSIDFLLLVGGVVLAAAGWPEAGGPVGALGLVMPALAWRAKRRGRGSALYALVPREVAVAHRGVLTAASLPGVVDGDDLVAEAGDLLLEVAALLSGRQPLGGAQRRFVKSRAAAMNSAAADLRERHQAWTEAQVEVEAIGSPLPPAATEETAGGPLVGAFVLVLFPLFLVWDVVRAGARAIVAVGDGILVRVRTIGRLGVQAVVSMGDAVVGAFRTWASLRDRVADAAREARHRVVAARLRMRLRLRRARRIARRA